MYNYGDQEFTTKKELGKFLIENKDKLIARKKAQLKKADCPVIVSPTIVGSNGGANKAAKAEERDPDSLKVIAVINTTNYLDNHGDVHIPGLWNRSLNQNKMIMHLQEHDMAFDKVIADGEQLNPYVKTYTWQELGYDYAGITEALVFESTILKERNPFMLNQYKNGWVRNHSVGMFYVKMDMAINDEDYPNEKEAWDKYYPQVANKDVADEKGFFWYVLEAKLIEGSSVPLGSNQATPTLSDKNDPPKGTQIADPQDALSEAEKLELFCKSLKF